MKTSKLAIYILFSLSLIFSVLELTLTSILFSKNKKPETSDNIDLTNKIKDSIKNILFDQKHPILDEIQKLFVENESLKKTNEKLFKLSATYLLLFNSLGVFLISLAFLTMLTKYKGRENFEVSIIGILILLKITVYSLLLVYRYIASKALEVSSAVLGFVNAAALLALLCLKTLILFN